MRVFCDVGPEKMGYKIRQAQMQKIPYMLVVGGREEESGSVSVRHRSGGDLGSMPMADFIAAATKELQSKSLEPLVRK
jgi:threonyl-tRNA synthetase